MSRTINKGFSLIELMITVAIIGIILAVGYPSYQSYVQESRRVEAQGSLLELAQWMERQFTVNGRYTDSSGAAPSLPFTKSPKDGGNSFYAITVAVSAAAFTLTASPSGAQSGDRCGTLSVTQTGSTDATGTDCW